MIAIVDAAQQAACGMGRDLLSPSHRDPSWDLDEVAGRFVELTGDGSTAALSVTAALVVETQRRGEFAAWIGLEASTFYPPDFAAAGIDLAALPVVRVVDAREALRATDMLLRSGSFALIIVDLGCMDGFPLSAQTRLVSLAKKHHATLLCISRQDPRPVSPGSLVSLRIHTQKGRIGHDGFQCQLRAVKDKQRSPGWTHRENCRGPGGLC